MRINNHKRKKIVIGSSLASLVYCSLNDCGLLYTRLSHPSIIEQPVTFLGKNYDARELWDKLFYVLSLNGNILFSDKIESLRIERHIVNVYTKRARKYEVAVDKFFIFDDHNVSGLPLPKEEKNKKYEVRDWLHVKSGMKHEHSLLTTDSEFVSRAIFYPTRRIDGNHDLKDVVAISYLTKDEMNTEEYSDINARFKTAYVMKSAGIRGTRNGRDTRDKTKYKYYAIKIENEMREIVYKMNKYESDDLLEFKYDSVSDIIKQSKEVSDVGKLFHKLA